MRIQNFISNLSHPSIVASGLILILLLGIVDYFTGQEISFSIFYLLPISFGVWYGGRTAGLMLSFADAVIWLLADLLAGHEYTHILIPYWNAIMRLGFFLIITYILMKLKTSRDRQEELSHFIVHDLRSPLSNVMELAELSLSQVSVLGERNDVELMKEFDERAGMIYADPELTVRILVNLLSNAIKFSPSGSKVALRIVPTVDKKTLFSITDQGHGISPEWIGKVFDKFTQVEARKKGAVVGSGLGLTFCRLAVEAQGGRIWLESEVGRGTTISFILPAGNPTVSFEKK